MKIDLIYTIVPCIDTLIASQFYKRVLNFKSLKESGDELLVEVNNNLKLKLEENEEYTNNMYTFKVDIEYFNLIVSNMKKEKIYFGSNINDLEDMKIYEDFEKKEFYIIDPNSHLFQIVTFIEN